MPLLFAGDLLDSTVARYIILPSALQSLLFIAFGFDWISESFVFI